MEKEDLEVRKEGAHAWVLRTTCGAVPTEDPVEVVPLPGGTPIPGSLKQGEIKKNFTLDKKTTMDLGYFFYQVILETPYHMSRQSGEKDIITLTYSSVQKVQNDTASTRKHVFDWAKTMGIDENLLLAVMKIA